MSKSNVVEFAGRDGIDDPLRELLRTGAGELVYQAVQAELQELLAEHSQRRLSGWQSRRGAQRLFAGARDSDGIGSGNGEDPEGASEDR